VKERARGSLPAQSEPRALQAPSCAWKLNPVERLLLFIHTLGIRELGRAGETAARWFLRRRGLVPVSRNWRGRNGELDLVCVDRRNRLVMVEVKTSLRADSAWEHFDAAKRRCLLLTARDYLRAHRLAPDQPWRLDLVVVTGDPRSLKSPLRFAWIRNAL